MELLRLSLRYGKASSGWDHYLDQHVRSRHTNAAHFTTQASANRFLKFDVFTKIFMLSHLLTMFRGDNPLFQAFDYNDNIWIIFVIKQSVNTKQI